MPEKRLSIPNLRLGASLAGIFLTAWTVLAAVLSLTDFTQIGTTMDTMGFPRWILPMILICVAVFQVFGHLVASRRVLVFADFAGGLVCGLAAGIIGYGAFHGEHVAIAALNWVLIGSYFLLHSAMLHQR